VLPYRIEWLDEAKSDIRRLDRPTAMRIFDAIMQVGNGVTLGVTLVRKPRLTLYLIGS